MLVKVGADIDTPSQYRHTAANSISVILGIANILEYLIEFGAYTPIVRVLASICRLRKN